MCGIVGIVDYTDAPIEAGLLERMRDIMVTRGPDDAGLYLEPGLGLGHRRLSIIDLSKAGHQPMPNEDKKIWLVCNGEIYNFKDLRSELISAGHRFRSRTDIEVLLHGYEQWGIARLAEKLRGMFAFAIWDGHERELHLARDHVGKKPLFYKLSKNRIFFSSDIKSIWLAHDGQLTINRQALDEFLYRYYITQNHSIFEGVEKLPPAHTATIREGKMLLNRYWAPCYSKKENKTVEEWLDGVDHYLGQAVRRRLIADVPIGAFLSGGVDSSIICAVMAREDKGKPNTYSVGFEDVSSYDERHYSRLVADHIGSKHTELVLNENVFNHLSNIVWHYGEPFGDSSMVPTYLVAKAASEYLKVVLTGDGGDECFAGYSRFLSADRDRRYRWLPALARKNLIPSLAASIVRIVAHSKTARRLDIFCKYLGADPTALATSISCWGDHLRPRLYSHETLTSLNGWHPVQSQRGILESLTGRTQFDRALEFVFREVLPGDYLTKVDVATMAHSLEARSPFLDLDLLSFAMTIPAELLHRNGTLKYLLKRYAENLIPNEVIYRQKRGFGIPVGHWFSKTWAQPLRRVLLSEQAKSRGWFRPKFIDQILKEHITGHANHDHRIWTLLVFEIWNRLFVDRAMAPGDPIFD